MVSNGLLYNDIYSPVNGNHLTTLAGDYQKSF
jgi:hypothetical protein